MKIPSVWITGAGVISCARKNAEQLWESALHNRSGMVEGLGWIDKSSKAQKCNKAIELCRHAMQQAMDQAGWRELGPRDGMILATTTGQVLRWDQSLVSYLQGRSQKADFQIDFSHQPLGRILDLLSDHQGPRSLVSSACTAATQAIGMAAAWIRSGKVERCLVGGVEVLCELTIEGFKSLQLLSPSMCRPFDKNRQGINLSEGSAFLCLETGESQNRLAKICGFGMTTDAYHMTSPHPEGKGCELSMLSALRSANLSPQDIDWIHAHGTGSQLNDLSEGKAIRSVFKEDSPYVISTKAIHGHALGASGLIETVFCLEALKHNTIIRTPGLGVIDHEIPVCHPERNSNKKLRFILKNTLGFGGANATFILGRVDENHDEY